MPLAKQRSLPPTRLTTRYTLLKRLIWPADGQRNARQYSTALYNPLPRAYATTTPLLWSTEMKRTTFDHRKTFGQSLVEYALLIALIAGIAVFGVVQLAPRIGSV